MGLKFEVGTSVIATAACTFSGAPPGTIGTVAKPASPGRHLCVLWPGSVPGPVPMLDGEIELAPEPSPDLIESLTLRAAGETVEEMRKAIAKWPPHNSAHEGFCVLLEEVEELKTHVFAKQERRDLAEMRLEAIQVAAMALRFVVDVCDGGRGRK